MLRIFQATVLLILLVLLPSADQARGATLNAFDVPATITTNGTAGNYVVGFEFTLSEPIEVTHLGKLDWYGDGLPEAASVGIWSTSQTATPLVSATIPAGAAADLDEFSGHGTLRYYYEAITPVELEAGTYRIGVTSGTETYAYDLSGHTWNGPITWTQGVADIGSTLSYPDDILRSEPQSYMGPNFKFIDPSSPPLPDPTGDLLQDIRNGHNRKIVTMGTSLTHTGLSDWVPQMTDWLRSQAPQANAVTVKNVGVSGASSDNANMALSGIQTQLPLALGENPDAVFIEFGINDAFLSYSLTPQQSKDNLESMIDQLQTFNPDVEIVLMTMNNPIGVHLANRPDVATYYQGYRDVAQARGLTLVDHYPNWTDLYTSDPTTWDRYCPDGIHPNSAGAVNVTLPQIRRTLDGEVTLAMGDFEGITVLNNYNFVPHNTGMGVWFVENATATGNALLLWNADQLASTFPDIHASTGAQMVTLQSEGNLGTISQAFDTTPGQEYEVTFDLSALVSNNTELSDQMLELLVRGRRI